MQLDGDIDGGVGKNDSPVRLHQIIAGPVDFELDRGDNTL